uniref:DNA-directed RNA polymerase n=1 Tax=Bougainvillea spectabilis TaxID=146096 RepID=A0A7T1T1Y6_9CARY|nr:DNA-dependent-RNA-polymerase [Bougainvillea spectabilis]QPP04907.1 DNA-dependent-RNA-polymerase [Bougainvillea spectabilis]
MERINRFLFRSDSSFPNAAYNSPRGIISLTSDLDGSIRVRKKGSSYYLPSHLYAVCNFDISLLPLKLNLPMVSKPIEWKSLSSKPKNMSDLVGGYLSCPTGYIYDRYRLLSSSDINHFYIDISGNNQFQELIDIMNKLQSQPFHVNAHFLDYLLANNKLFEESGLIMPKFLASMNYVNVIPLLREMYMGDPEMKEICSFNDLLQLLSKNIQRARYEQLIIKLATAYKGYDFYLPAFLDFRGRIYRCGVLHFHERDLARSLIVLGKTPKDKILSEEEIVKRKQQFLDVYENKELLKRIMIATSFHYKSFDTPKEGGDWYLDTIYYPGLLDKHKELIEMARCAKRPFQFLSHQLNLNIDYDDASGIPITQDASASAYQIMSYFLMDETLAMRTNLIPSEDGKIQDVYSYILAELKEFLLSEAELEKNLSTVVCNTLNRKIVKSIFMPMIYGKTVMSTASDLKDHLSHYITHKESFIVASACFKFWRIKFHGLECLIKLIRHIGWVASARNSPVYYNVKYYTTIQDYRVMKPVNIWVYDRHHKKRRKVTLRVSSDQRDRRKTEISTFVNFIHQKDAFIAMEVVRNLFKYNVPIYTVHDNFISSAEVSSYIPHIYNEVFYNMGPPLSIINSFIYMNIIKPVKSKLKFTDELNEDNITCTVISKEKLETYLRENFPKNQISTREKKIWDERISGILASYENYISIVCGDFQSYYKSYINQDFKSYRDKEQKANMVKAYKNRILWKAHEEKWEIFSSKLNISFDDPLYSLHH